MHHALKLPEQPHLTGLTPVLPFADYYFPQKEVGWNGIVLVGEAPGAEEAKLGLPFVGRSGQLLDKTLEIAEIKRANCLIANVFRHQPPRNKIDHFFSSRGKAVAQGIALAESYGKFGSAFCRAEFAPEIEHLRAILARDKPAIIVALGRTSLWALTGENGLLDKVGRPLPCRLLPSVQVIPTFHPSFILRGNWRLQDEWVMHLKLANHLAHS